MTEQGGHFDIVVVGAGPAGIAASIAAAHAGARVALLDDAPREGGALWARSATAPIPPPARSWMQRFHSSRAQLLSSTSVVDAPLPGCLRVEREATGFELHYDALVLATGARELFLPFPGWTLPGVTGAGGLQLLVKGGTRIDGQRVVVAGSGPLLLAAAAFLKQRGAQLLAVAEQASLGSVARMAPAVLARSGKLREALSLWRESGRVRPQTGWWPVRALGKDRLRAVVLSNGSRTRELECDWLACGFGLVPQVELAQRLGCRLRDGRVVVDEWQRSSIDGVFAAGELTGISGVDGALAEGSIAGHVAAGEPEAARSWSGIRARARDFGRHLARSFALRPELRSLPDDATWICRCEDVSFGRVRAMNSAREAKLQTRCGMGACQGRICGPALGFLFDWESPIARPPLAPAALSSLLAASSESHQPRGSQP